MFPVLGTLLTRRLSDDLIDRKYRLYKGSGGSSTYGRTAEPANMAELVRFRCGNGQREAGSSVNRYSRSCDSMTYLPLNRTLATACREVRSHMPSTSANCMRIFKSWIHQEGFFTGLPSSRRIL